MVTVDTVRDAIALVRGRIAGDDVGISFAVATMSTNERRDVVVALTALVAASVRTLGRLTGYSTDELLVRLTDIAERML